MLKERLPNNEDARSKISFRDSEINFISRNTRTSCLPPQSARGRRRFWDLFSRWSWPVMAKVGLSVVQTPEITAIAVPWSAGARGDTGSAPMGGPPEFSRFDGCCSDARARAPRPIIAPIWSPTVAAIEGRDPECAAAVRRKLQLADGTLTGIFPRNSAFSRCYEGKFVAIEAREAERGWIRPQVSSS